MPPGYRKRLTDNQVALARDLMRPDPNDRRVARAQTYYARFIGSRAGRSIAPGLEAHHIVPICLGGADHPSNLVYLTPKEHAHAHLVLWKAYPKSTSIVHAAVLMNFKDGRQLPSNIAASLRTANSKASRAIADDPDRYNAYRDAQLQGMAKPGVVDKIVAGNTKKWADPEFRAKNSEGVQSSRDSMFHERFVVFAEFLRKNNRRPTKRGVGKSEFNLYVWAQNNKVRRPIIQNAIDLIDSGGPWREFLEGAIRATRPDDSSILRQARKDAADLQERLLVAGLLPTRVAVRRKKPELDRQIERWTQLARAAELV
jgi:hypothetical protein